MLMGVVVLGVFPSQEATTYQSESIFQTVSFLQSEMAPLSSGFVQLGETLCLLARQA